jgi:hypothetical protein
VRAERDAATGFLDDLVSGKLTAVSKEEAFDDHDSEVILATCPDLHPRFSTCGSDRRRAVYYPDAIPRRTGAACPTHVTSKSRCPDPSR